MDIVTAHRGSTALYFLKGNGHGSFAAAKRFDVTGSVTDLIAGEMNQPDGLTDLVVGLAGADSFAVAVYQSPTGALKATPETFTLGHAATSLALGKFTGSLKRDLAIGAGNELILVHGRDRKLSAPGAEPAAPAVVTKQSFAFSIVSLVAGDFTGRAPSVAALGNDGNVHILEHSISAAALAETIGNASAQPSMQIAGAHDDSPTAPGTSGTSAAQARVAALRQMVHSAQSDAEWTERSSVALPGGASVSAHGLVAAHISGSQQDDLVIADESNSQLHVLSTRTAQGASKPAVTAATVPQMNLLSSLSATTGVAAVLPMRLSPHGLSGLVALQANVGGPVVMPQDVAPAAVFTVTNTLDITDASQKNSPPAGSLRAAMLAAQAASGTNGGGTYSIVFNIPTTDPGYNAATGIFKIQPLSENVPNSLDNFALPPINATLTIDGYTQPGASPNTSTTSDNARILIQIDGAKATTTGGAGLVPFDDVGSVFRGMAFTGWTNPAISNNTASGAEGIEANGVGDFIEGNYFGTADGKTSSANRIGIFADNGPLFGSAPGNIIGGTTPQARNILSGNNNSGILFLSTAYEAQLQGNFIGLDSTGAAVLPNPMQAGRSNIFDGAGLNGPTVTIGGTLPGAGNVIAGNGTNVDINDLTNGGAAKNSFVVGNLIGTDATGTKSFSGPGYGVSILHSVSNMTIGGTTPAARNVISGNFAGIYVFDNSQNNLVQGNYIGTDITGTVAVPNTGQGFISGTTTSNSLPSAGTIIGGSIAGAGNVISGNGADGIQISGAYSSSPGYTPYVGSIVQGNFIGTDPTGTKSLPNRGNGVSFLAGATNNVVGGSQGGLGNIIANNTGNGVLIDPGTSVGPGVANTTVANTIFSNGGAGVRVSSGTGNRISANSIYSNAALGIDIGTAGPNTNSHCQVTNTGGNLSQNYPVLTAGTGNTYISATATDASGNTSEFSPAVQATQAANILSLLGSFDGKANSTFTLEFFSNSSADSSGYGQGKTYLGSTTITTDANCSGTVTKPVDLTTADVSVNLTNSTQYVTTGPDFGLYATSATVVNNGPATAHNVVFTDTLPSQLVVSGTYCSVGRCQSPITTTQGTCTVSGQTITCNLGALATGSTASIFIPYQALVTGSVTNTGNVTATEVDPNLPNNVSSTTVNVTDPYPFIDHLDPATVLVNSPDIAMNVYGFGFTQNTTVAFNGTPVTVKGVVDNQICGGAFQPQFCTALQVTIPAAQLTTAGTYGVVVSDAAGDTNSANLTVVPSCTYSVFNGIDSNPQNSGTNLIASTLSVTTNVPSCAWTATSSVPWATILDNASASGSGTVDVAIAPNATTSTRTGSVTVAGQTFNFTQAAGSASVCTVGLDPSSLTADPAGSSGTINATLSNSSCAPFVEPYPQNSSATQWINITNKSNLLLVTGPVNFTVAKNNGPARTGAIVVGGNAVTVTQAAPSCYFTLSSNSMVVSAAGTTGSIAVTPTPSSCSWTATPSNTAQVSISSGASGTGNGTINYTVAANAGGPITPTITVGNSTATSLFTVNQASAHTCTFTVSPNPVSVTSNGTSNVFTVTASFNFCRWTAASNNPDSLALTGSTSKTGSGAVYYSVAKNTTSAARTLTVTAGCQTFTVNQAGPLPTVTNNPVPTLTSLQPSSTAAGSPAFTLTVNGTGFVNGATVNFNGTSRTTTFVSATQLTAAITAADVASQGSAPVTVTNPTPGGGTSNALTFTINAANNPTPTIASIQNSSTTAGSPAFTLTVNGTGFVGTSTVNFNGAPRTTTYVSATQLTAAIPASDVATKGTAPVTVTNPSPGGGTSNSVVFTINAADNPTPTLTSLAPATTAAGSAAFTLTVNGTNFVNGATVSFNGSTKTTTFVSATQLTAAILAGDVATQGTASVTVANPTPGGGVSNALTFTITAANNPVPAITTLAPASATAGSAAFTLTVNGTGFVSGSTVSFNGSTRMTNYVSATQVTAAITAADIANVGTAPVTVTNNAPGGGTSNAATFTITAAVVNNPVPVLTSLTPASITAGSAAFTLTVNGTGFVTGATVNFNGTTRVTTYLSATQVTAAILSSDVASAGTASVTVNNPAPGGGTSNVLNFTTSAVVVNNPVPTIATLTPSSVFAGSGAQTLTLNGTNFLSSSTVTVNGTLRVSTFVSATQLTVALLAADVTTAGTDSIVVTNPTPGGGASNVGTLTIAVGGTPSFTVSSNTAPQTISAGTSAQYTIVVTAQNGTISGPVTLSASGLPSGFFATFAPTFVTPGNASASSTFTVHAPLHAQLQKRLGSSWPVFACVFPLFGVLLLNRSRRGVRLMLVLLAICCIGGLSGCGSSVVSYATNPQTYTITVTGTNGTIQQTTAVKLTVNF